MLQRIEAMNAAARDKQKGGTNLLESHVFQFDFLNDPLLDDTGKEGNITKKSKLLILCKTSSVTQRSGRNLLSI